MKKRKMNNILAYHKDSISRHSVDCLNSHSVDRLNSHSTDPLNSHSEQGEESLVFYGRFFVALRVEASLPIYKTITSYDYEGNIEVADRFFDIALDFVRN